MPTVSLHTLGCKLNYAETSMLGKQFLDRGFSLVEFGRPADVCVINTCSVTERANRECRQMVRRAVRNSPDSFIVVTGCYAQLQPDEVASIQGVDLVLGTREKFDIFDYIGGLERKLYPQVIVSEIEAVDSFGASYSNVDGDRTRAFLKIQDGCDYNCSFCTIPLARGKSRSQSPDATVKQAEELVRGGFKEITLTGVNVGDYGPDGGTDLLPLLRRLVRVEGLERVRISSIEPNLLSDEIIDFVASEPKMCEHFHVPLQSGCDDVLRLMRRRYTAGLYRDRIGRIRKTIPECGIGADVIVGFPGETEERFLSTFRFIEGLELSYLHVFTYSERPQTPAAVFPGKVEPRVRFRRNEILRTVGWGKKRDFYTRQTGRTVTVLMEGVVESGMRYGFTGNYVRVAVPAEEAAANVIVPVEVTEVRGDRCVGRIVKEKAAA